MSISSISSRGFSSSISTFSSVSKTSTATQTSTAAAKTSNSSPANKAQHFNDAFDAAFKSASASGAQAGSRDFGDKMHNALKAAGIDDETIKTTLAGLNGGKTRDQASTTDDSTDAVSSAQAGSRAFGDRLHNALKSEGVDDETIKSVLAGLNGGKTRDQASTTGDSTDAVSGAQAGSRAFGDQLHHALQSAGVDDETIKSVLAGLNGGQSKDSVSASSSASSLTDLFSQLDDSTLESVTGSEDVLDQLKAHPELAAQLAQNPEVFRALMNSAA